LKTRSGGKNSSFASADQIILKVPKR